MGFKTEQFVEKVDDNLKCSICLEVLENPWQCKDGHTFCKDCITRCLEDKQMCPMCKNALQLESLGRSLLAKTIVENLEVYCHPPQSDWLAETEVEKSELKCDWTGKLQSLAKHRETCPFQQVQCPNVNCNTNMQRKELENHDKICEYKKVECDEHCGVTLIRRDLTNHKRHDCPEVSLPCPNRCATTLKRKNMSTHREMWCPLQHVWCPNYCKKRMKRRELNNHVSICEYQVVECNKCKEGIIRRDLQFHKNVYCPEEMDQCPNSCRCLETGQIHKVKRKLMNVQEHIYGPLETSRIIPQSR